MTDRTEALDIEAARRQIEAGLRLPRYVVDPMGDMTRKESLEALDRLIQALRAERLNRAALKALHEQCERNMDAEITRLNDERERVRALVEKWREDATMFDGRPEGSPGEFVLAAIRGCTAELQAALSHPISPERSEGEEK